MKERNQSLEEMALGLRMMDEIMELLGKMDKLQAVLIKRVPGLKASLVSDDLVLSLRQQSLGLG